MAELIPAEAEVDDFGRTPLMKACKNGTASNETEPLKLIEEGNTNINATTHLLHGRCSALHYAAGNGMVKTVEALISRGVKVDPVDSEGRQPLHHAARMGHVAILKALIQAGADPTVLTMKVEGPSIWPATMAGMKSSLRW
jgi:ankyrin repeat protein